MEHLNKQTAGKKKKTLLIVAIVLAALLLIAGGLGLYAASEIGGWGGDDGQLVTVTVEKGASTAAIASALKEEGVIGSKTLFRLYSKLNGGDGTYQFGNHELPKKAAYKDVIAALQQTAINENVATVTIPEGYSLPQIAAALEKEGYRVLRAYDGMEALDKRFSEGNLPMVLDIHRPNLCADFKE